MAGPIDSIWMPLLQKIWSHCEGSRVTSQHSRVAKKRLTSAQTLIYYHVCQGIDPKLLQTVELKNPEMPKTTNRQAPATILHDALAKKAKRWGHPSAVV